MVRILAKIMVRNKCTGKEPKRRYLFQGNSTISEHWFDLDIDWVAQTSSTREYQFYKRLLQTNIEGRSGITYPIFPITIGNAKETSDVEYYIQAPLVAYHQNYSINGCFGSLTSAFDTSVKSNTAREIEILIEELLHCKYQGYKDWIEFANAIISDQVRNSG